MRRNQKSLASNRSLWCGSAIALVAAAAQAQPPNPRYQLSFDDCVTSDNRFVGQDGQFQWDVDAGCDIYQVDLYERPTTQTFKLANGRFGAFECFEYLDIVQAKVGMDSRFLYVSIDLFGRDHLTSDGSRIEKGLVERYGFRMSTDPDGRYGLLVVADQPEVKNEPNTVFGPLGTFAHIDTNGDVGGADREGPTGLSVTKSDNPDEADGLNGYDTVLISDGRIGGDGPRVLWVRLNPRDNTVVEIALDYRTLGISQQQLRRMRYLEFEAIKGGPKDPQNYLWNDKYTKREAGSPNRGRNGLSEFGTQGCENIYEVDTARGVTDPN